MHPVAYFLFLTLFCVFAQGFFSMFEMAAVSFNKVRLHYYVGQNHKLALWLHSLMKNPSRLFGTTLIGINTFLQFGSEFSRRFYESLNLNPDFAPFTQIIIVLIFGELAPMFAARRYPEHVAFLYIPVVYLISKILTPIIWFIDKLNYVIHLLFKRSSNLPLFLSREEVQRAFEEKETSQSSISTVVSNFFSLKNKRAKDVMTPIGMSQLISSNATHEEMRFELSHNYSSFLPVYHKHIFNIVGIVYPRDLLEKENEKKVVDYARPPWFITEELPVIDIIQQFRSNNQTMAVVVDSMGEATGVLTLRRVVEEMLGKISSDSLAEDEEDHIYFEKTVSGDMPLEEFNQIFHAELVKEGAETLSEYIGKSLQHHPVKGEKVIVDRLWLIVVEPSLFGAKTVLVRTEKHF